MLRTPGIPETDRVKPFVYPRRITRAPSSDPSPGLFATLRVRGERDSTLNVPVDKFQSVEAIQRSRGGKKVERINQPLSSIEKTIAGLICLWETSRFARFLGCRSRQLSLPDRIYARIVAKMEPRGN